MEITVKRELDISELYDDLLYWLGNCDAVESARLTEEDFTPEVLGRVFTALAGEANDRAE